MNNLIKSVIILNDNITYGVKKFTRATYKERLAEEGLSNSDTTINRILKYMKDDLGIHVKFKRNGFAEIIGEPDSFGLEKITHYKSFYLRSILHKSALDNQLFNQTVSFGLDTVNYNIDFLQPLLNAIIKKNIIKFDYQSFWNNQKKSYSAKPIFLKEYLNRWYIIAETDETPHRVFALDRISELKVSNKTFFTNPNVSTQIYKHTIGVNFSGEPQKIMLWVSPEQYNYFKTLPIHKSQKFERMAGDDGYIISLYVVINFELERWILYYGNKIKVLEPKVLRNSIARELKETLHFYN